MIAERPRLAEELHMARVQDIVAAGNEDSDHQGKGSANLAGAAALRQPAIWLSASEPLTASHFRESLIPVLESWDRARWAAATEINF
jgi:hypothetical protein